MHIPRFFLTSEDVITPKASGGSLSLFAGDTFDITSGLAVNQITNVLRLRPDDRLIVLNGQGQIFRCKIVDLAKRAVSCIVCQAENQTEEASVNVTVALAMLKGERFDWSIQKLTELGVSVIVPLVTARTIVKIGSGTTDDAKGQNNKTARWQAIAREAAEQSERVTIPHIVSPKKLEDFIMSSVSAREDNHAFICAERLSTTPLKDILREHFCNRLENFGTTCKTISVIVGPEGGFTDTELSLAQNHGVMPVSLGSRILRSETAAIYALAQIMWCLEK